mmetsp:Transcript_110763/g.320049  ORF Transcript_110763/g.320049 Transcript_110763/m.320049 type:complete len:326 (-) Transcript_110763:109-1086(-)
MGLKELRVLPTCVCSCCCGWLLFGLIALPLSFKALDQGKYALELNWMTQKIGSSVHSEPGMKMVGLGNMLVEFPSTLQTMYFVNDGQDSCDDDVEYADCPAVVRRPVKARSLDGLEMDVSVSLQWRLTAGSLKQLYTILGADLYKDEFVRFARSAIVEACSMFTADMYFTNRTEITAVMFERLVNNFKQPDLGLDVEIEAMQLHVVDLPDAYNEEITNTQEQMQEIEVAHAEREEMRISKEREMLVEQEQVLQVVEEARGEAERLRVENVAVVENMLNYQRRQARANAEVLQNFQDDPEPFQRLFEVMKVRMLQDHGEDKLLINL